MGNGVVEGTKALGPVWAGPERSGGERSAAPRSGEPAQTATNQTGVSRALDALIDVLSLHILSLSLAPALGPFQTPPD